MDAHPLCFFPKLLPGLALIAVTLIRTFWLPGAFPLVPVFIVIIILLSIFLMCRAGLTDHSWFPAVFALIGLLMLIRVCLLDFVSDDYSTFLSHWMAFFKENGGIGALRFQLGDYNVPYLYILAILSYLPTPDLYSIKLVSVLFDILLAWGGLRIVRILAPDSPKRQLTSFCLLFMLPTVILNGACWGQCDSVYASILLHAFADALDEHPCRSVLLLSLAFSFKLQTVFLLPLWVVLWYTGRVKFRNLLLFPVGCSATALPALLLGRPLKDILMIYLGQTGEYLPFLSMNAPSIYAFLPYGKEVNTGLAVMTGIFSAFLFTGLLLVILFTFRSRADESILLAVATVLSIAVPFLLPSMHERYFFLADVLTVILACVMPAAGILPALLTQASSLSCYSAYLRLEYTHPIRIGNQLLVMGLEAGSMALSLLFVILILIGLVHRRGLSDQFL